MEPLGPAPDAALTSVRSITYRYRTQILIESTDRVRYRYCIAIRFHRNERAGVSVAGISVSVSFVFASLVSYRSLLSNLVARSALPAVVIILTNINYYPSNC